jgi:hypothetical protein
MRTTITVPLLAGIVCIACEPEAAPADIDPEPIEEPSRAPAAIATPRTWPGAPPGFQAMALEGGTDSCDAPIVFVGESAVSMDPPSSDRAARDDLPAGAEREVAELFGPIAVLRMMTSAYNGPGGEPHVRWYLSLEPPVLVFDRRVDRARFLAAFRGTDFPTVRVGGIDQRGERSCVLLLRGVPEDLPAAYTARATRGGGLHLASGERVAPRSAPSLFAGERDSGLHVVDIQHAGAEPEDILGALAVARLRDRRYPALAP